VGAGVYEKMLPPVLPIEVVAVLVFLVWGSVAIAWVLIERWETGPVTEARRREIERQRSERPPSGIGKLVWIVSARAITAAVPLLCVIDGFSDRIGILYSPGFSFTAGPDLALQIAGIIISAVGLAILIVLGRMLAARVYALAAHERELITTGLHRYIQHPFYVHFFLLPVGLFLLTLNYLALLVLISYTTLWGPKLLTSWIREEEVELRRLFGADYDAYAARTGRFFPRIRRSS
jgi:protein-S-isoprenylcysteine O-methyltransferase Ste14